MALSIHTNYSALTTNTALNKSNSSLATNQQRLGTGLRINSAADDAAGLQIATRLNAQSRGMGVAMRNVGDATSMLQTAEGAFSEMTDIMQRMKDLATQGANGTNSADDLTALQGEYDELGKELANIMDNTSYAGEELFSRGDTAGKFFTAVTFQIGATSAETLKMDLSDATGSSAITTLTDALDGMSAAYTAGAAADTTGVEISASANATVDLVSTALDAIGSLRAEFGSTINRLSHTSNNLANMKDNTEMAKGRIMDADFAIESANMSKNSMLMQSGISMLKQAGQMPGMVMGLLG
ncbi:lateral flagellin LafA [Stutzerimonas zhaodongensis]|jgi:flagellin|uniref:Flagellin n=1 Tax=Stutzerimonas zhaodongensis TaxID=1176257 RepID=A0A365PX56_9GAMM|nr:lateral flagellin LafA [Stutzerimonas zhaodongensis]QWV17698.1 lateral flagellin LafA [Stutzerimonas zhaodongensis]RBA60350.1 Lateral flagellin [Stutzerimonas zhaodongensis]